MIKMQIIGHLGKDAVMKEFNGKKVINFSVCHTEKRKNAKGELVEKSTWVECGKWGDSVGVLPYLLKGKLVYVEGSPDVNAYLTKEQQPAGSLRLLVDRIELLGGGGGQASNTAASTTGQPATAAKPVDDDVPF